MPVLYLILFIASVFFYILYEPAFSFYLFVFLLIVPIILFITDIYIRNRLSVNFVTVQKAASRCSKIPLVIKIINRSKLPVANLIIEIEYMNSLDKIKSTMKINTPIFPNDTQYLTLHVSGLHYGTIQMRIKRCRITDFLKLFKFKVKYPKAEEIYKSSTFTILPDYIPIENNIANYSEMGLETNEYSKSSKGDDPSEIFDIHEYMDGDKISRIHWKLSAKQNKTMVKDYSLPISNSIILLVNLEITSSNNEMLTQYDTMIETVAAISNYLTANETPHKVIWYDNNKSQLITLNAADEESGMMLINMLLQTPIYKQKDLALLNYINETERFKCGHLMYFSTSYRSNLTEIMNDSELAYKYSYMLIDDKAENIYDEFSQIIPIKSGKVAQSIQDMCF